MPTPVRLTEIAASVHRPGLLRPLLAPLIHRLGGARNGEARFAVHLSLNPDEAATSDEMVVSWDAGDLAPLNPYLTEELLEVAARASGGRNAFNTAISNKRTAVGAIAALEQGYISVWGLDIAMGHKELVIPRGQRPNG